MKSYAYLHSPVGLLEIIERAGKIISISFCESKTHVSYSNILLEEALLQLNSYFKNQSTFNLPLDLQGSEFGKKVYEALIKIPLGETISYKALAKLAGSPKAYRAVGSVMAKNRFVIVIPCHRVIKEDGSLGNYSSPRGAKTKEWLLNMEKK